MEYRLLNFGMVLYNLILKYVLWNNIVGGYELNSKQINQPKTKVQSSV